MRITPLADSGFPDRTRKEIDGLAEVRQALLDYAPTLTIPLNRQWVEQLSLIMDVNVNSLNVFHSFFLAIHTRDRSNPLLGVAQDVLHEMQILRNKYWVRKMEYETPEMFAARQAEMQTLTDDDFDKLEQMSLLFYTSFEQIKALETDLFDAVQDSLQAFQAENPSGV